MAIKVGKRRPKKESILIDKMRLRLAQKVWFKQKRTWVEPIEFYIQRWRREGISFSGKIAKIQEIYGALHKKGANIFYIDQCLRNQVISEKSYHEARQHTYDDIEIVTKEKGVQLGVGGARFLGEAKRKSGKAHKKHEEALKILFKFFSDNGVDTRPLFGLYEQALKAKLAVSYWGARRISDMRKFLKIQKGRKNTNPVVIAEQARLVRYLSKFEKKRQDLGGVMHEVASLCWAVGILRKESWKTIQHNVRLFNTMDKPA